MLSADCIQIGLSQRGGEGMLPQMHPGRPQPGRERGWTLSLDCVRGGLSQKGGEGGKGRFRRCDPGDRSQIRGDGRCPQTASWEASAREGRGRQSKRGVRAQDRLELQPCNASY